MYYETHSDVTSSNRFVLPQKKSLAGLDSITTDGTCALSSLEAVADQFLNIGT